LQIYFNAGSIYSQARCLEQKRKEQTVGMFQLLTTLLIESNDKLSQEIEDHLKLLRTEMMHYFPYLVSCTYAVNPFCIDPAFLPVGTGEQEEIIDIQADDTAKAKQK